MLILHILNLYKLLIFYFNNYYYEIYKKYYTFEHLKRRPNPNIFYSNFHL